MKLLQLQKYLGFAGIAAALAFFYTDYLIESDKESFHLFSVTTISLMQSAAFILVLLFFTASTVFVNRRLKQLPFKKPFVYLLVSGLLSLIIPCMLFFEWAKAKLTPKKEPTAMDTFARGFAETVFPRTQRIESLQNTANILFLLLSILMVAVFLLAVINAKKKNSVTKNISSLPQA